MYGNRENGLYGKEKGGANEKKERNIRFKMKQDGFGGNKEGMKREWTVEGEVGNETEGRRRGGEGIAGKGSNQRY